MTKCVIEITAFNGILEITLQIWYNLLNVKDSPPSPHKFLTLNILLHIKSEPKVVYFFSFHRIYCHAKPLRTLKPYPEFFNPEVSQEGQVESKPRQQGEQVQVFIYPIYTYLLST